MFDEDGTDNNDNDMHEDGTDNNDVDVADDDQQLPRIAHQQWWRLLLWDPQLVANCLLETDAFHVYLYSIIWNPYIFENFIGIKRN